MPRGGKREGAGRKSKGNHLNPRAIKEISEKIKIDWLLRKLHAHIDGGRDGTMSPSAVTAALGLLRKKMPDLSSVDHSGKLENVIYAVGDKPLTDDEWDEKYTTTH